MIINHISALMAGFSIVSSLVLLFTYLLFLPDMRKTRAGKLACTIMLLGICALQLGHYLFFYDGYQPLASRYYCSVLMLLPSSFFFFGREVLFSDVKYHWYDGLHTLPVLACAFLPIAVIPGFAFLMGTIYTVGFTKVILQMHGQRSRFKFELFFFGMFALMAFAALLLGLSLPFIDHGIFYYAYGNSISVAIVLIVAALLIFPELLSDFLLAAELAYNKSKLAGVDTDAKVMEMERLMTHEKYYENESLNLAVMAEVLDLSSHQLSELINTEYGYGFPRFVREHRVRVAKSLLIAEPDTSVLAISMVTGFKSQSNFYTAFKELTGESPGSYRRQRLL